MTNTSIVLALKDPALNEAYAHALRQERDLTVVSRTRTLVATYAFVEEHLPDAVVISGALASLREFEVMRALFETFDIRWLVVNDGPARRSAQAPRKSDLFEIDAAAGPADMIGALRALTRSRRRAADPRAAAGTAREGRTRFGDKMILIGASTGGIDALTTMLKHFPDHCPPTLIVQHTGAGFGRSLARLLDHQSAASVVRAENGTTLAPGRIILAAGCKTHMLLRDTRARAVTLTGTEPENGHMPSVDMLFRSAVPVAERVVAVQLTGMGRDGAAGMRALRDAGATTIAQDEASSVVYGMPRAAVEMGGVQRSLPLSEIGAAALAACESRKSMVG